MILVLGFLVGLAVAVVVAAGWGGADLLLGTRTLTEDRVAGLLLICPALCTVGIVGIIACGELRS